VNVRRGEVKAKMGGMFVGALLSATAAFAGPTVEQALETQVQAERAAEAAQRRGDWKRSARAWPVTTTRWRAWCAIRRRRSCPSTVSWKSWR